jgi:hypothetical protein
VITGLQRQTNKVSGMLKEGKDLNVKTAMWSCFHPCYRKFHAKLQF